MANIGMGELLNDGRAAVDTERAHPPPELDAVLWARAMIINQRIKFLEIRVDFHVQEGHNANIRTATRAAKARRRKDMDLTMRFIEMHTKQFVESRLASASTYRYGNGSPLATIIGAIAARI
ncbi:MAG: hypothetical protein WBO97_09295, partial [Tepidiformaceae bacterium]